MTYKSLIITLSIAATISSINAQEPLLHLRFNDRNTESSTVSEKGPPDINVSMFDSSGNPAALQRADGVSGKPGDFAFDNSEASGMGKGFEGGWAQTVIDARSTPWEAGFSSFTITGWLYATHKRPTEGARLIYVFGSDPGQSLVLWAMGDGRIELRIGEMSAGQSEQALSNAVGRWVFFAVTYQQDESDKNVRYYIGDTYKESNLQLVGEGRLDAGLWTPGMGGSQQIRVLIGNGGEIAQRPFQGFLDEFRIISSEDSADGALNEGSLNQIRIANLENQLE